MKKIKFLIAAVTMMVMAAMPVKAQMQQPDFDAKYATELIKAGTVAPNFKLKNPEGKTVNLAKFKGKYVVLDFWASWCPDCRKDIPNVQRMYRKFAPKGVEFIGVSFDTNQEAWTNALKKYDIRYTQVSELKKMRESQVAQQFGVKWIPSMVLIDPQGKVVLSTVLSYKMEKTLTDLLPTGVKPEADVKQISIDGSKGKLSAELSIPKNAGSKVNMAIIMHGFMGNKNEWLLKTVSDSLLARGIATLRFDFNGHGQSEGKFEEMTVPNELEDAMKVYEYVRNMNNVGDIYLLGHSQGGVVTSMLAGKLDNKISAVVLMAPAAVLREDAIRGNTMGAQYNPLDPPEEGVKLWGGKVLGAEFIRTAFRLPIYETAAGYQGKAAIIHGTADRIVPYTYGIRYHQLWKGSEYFELDDFDHGFSQNVNRVAEIAAGFVSGTEKEK